MTTSPSGSLTISHGNDEYNILPPTKKRKLKDTRPWNDILLSGFAGGIAGCVAKTSVAPLDRVKILFQAGEPQYAKYSGSFTGVFRACADIFRNEGLRGLLQGHSVTLLRIFPYAAIKFMAYEQFSFAGSSAGITSVLFTYPLELVRVRLAYDTRHRTAENRITLKDTLSKIYHEGDLPVKSDSSIPSKPPITKPAFETLPLLKFYRGFSVSIIGMIPYAGVSFLVWGKSRPFINSLLPPETGRKHRTMIDLGAGAIAGATSQTASYPFEVIRRRMQVGGILRPDRLIGFWETFGKVYKANGWRGFFIGLSISYLKIVPMTSVSYTTWEFLKRHFGIEK